MNDRITTDKLLIDPIYSQNEPNQSIDLGQVSIRFNFQDTTYEKAASVAMTFRPKHRLGFTVPFEDMFPWTAFSKNDFNVSLTLADNGITFESNWETADGKMVLSPNQSAVTVTQPHTNISTAKFHLFNFPKFYGLERYVLTTGEPPLQGAKTCGLVTLKADGWIITIAATDRTDDLEKQLKNTGGYVMTHMGQIAREDGTTFTSDQLDDILNCLFYFLSLALGCWAGVDLPIGFDCDGNRVFERWGMGRTSQGPWNSFCSWFNPHHSELLSQVFPGFLLLWKSDLWHTPLVHALYWYIGACKGGTGIGIDTGLILAQTALELLAWTYCVKDRNMVSPKAFKHRNGLIASDKMRLLASSMNIPIEIPSSLSALHGRPGKKWEDALEAIVDIRNSLIHPDNQLTISDGSYFEAYMLSLWFINLVFLRLCNHKGRYLSILPTTSSGLATFDQVPWVKD
jgi:hypothetical protein